MADITSIKNFYSREAGKATEAVLEGRLTGFLEEAGGNFILIGYPPEFLKAHKPLLIVSPQGVGTAHFAVPSLLADMGCLPFSQNSVEYILVLHGGFVPYEVGRVLAPNGKAVFIVPNRGSPWRVGRNPFALERAYSAFGVRRALAGSGLSLVGHRHVLLHPPFSHRYARGVFPVVEKYMRPLAPFWAGAHVVFTVKKQLQPVKKASRKRKISVQPV